jgi:hypothetical protein
MNRSLSDNALTLAIFGLLVLLTMAITFCIYQTDKHHVVEPMHFQAPTDPTPPVEDEPVLRYDTICPTPEQREAR